MSTATTREEELRGQAPRAELPAAESHKALPAPQKPVSGSKARKWIILLAILLAVAAVVWIIHRNGQKQAAQSQKMEAAANRPTPVQTQAVRQRTMPIYLTALGTVTAYNTVTIKTRVDGQLLRVNVREGQAVRKGQLLVEIDPGPYQAALAQAEGQLTKDQANARNADAEAARYTALYQAGVVSKESQQTQLSTAGQATGTIQADQAAIQAARVNLAYTRISSPIDGVVGLRQVDPGNIVHAADATGLLVVTQIHPIAVIFTLPEDVLPRVLQRTRAGQKLVVDAFDRSDSTHLATGSLLTVDNQIDVTTGTDKVKAVFDNHEGMLFPNQFVNIRLILEQQQNAIVVPSVAIQNGTQGNFVYVVKQGEPPADKQDNAETGGAAGAKGTGGGTHGAAAGQQPTERQQGGPSYYVEAVPVKVNLTEGAQVVLAGGVKQGDQIVVDGQEKLKDGSRVIPRAVQGNVPAAAGVGASSTKGTAQGAQSGGRAPKASQFETQKPGETQAIDESGKHGHYGKQQQQQQQGAPR
jgi:multidrug efflux system membrane fusion protein